jgi:Zn-finger nucleic acid-binding protein
MKKKLFLIENTKNNTDILLLSHNVSKGDSCPECGEMWDKGDIFEYFLEQKNNPESEGHNYYKDKTLKEIKETASSYGWSKKDKKRFSNLIGVELAYDDPERYDGVSYWLCPGCNVSWSRFDGKRTERFIPKCN